MNVYYTNTLLHYIPPEHDDIQMYLSVCHIHEIMPFIMHYTTSHTCTYLHIPAHTCNYGVPLCPSHIYRK